MATEIYKDTRKTAKPVAAGVINIVVGAGCILCALGMIGTGAFSGWIFPAAYFNFNFWPLLMTIMRLPGAAMGGVAILGGVFGLQSRRWGWALAGSIVTLFVSNVLGIVTVVLTALSKDEFNS
jgi:hypothetical protein